MSTLAHNLRAPATLIRGNVELLLEALRERGQDTADLRPTVDALQRALQRMSVMVDDFYLVTRLEAGTLALTPAPVVLQTALPALLARAAPTLETARITLDVPADVPPVRADPNALDTILQHLLENAQKFSDSQTPIRITARRADGRVEIAVIDVGIGIAPEEQVELFTRFYRAGHTHRAEGTGLGLYIVKCLAEAQGGQVRVVSAPGTGSTFAFTLPAA